MIIHAGTYAASLCCGLRLGAAKNATIYSGALPPSEFQDRPLQSECQECALMLVHLAGSCECPCVVLRVKALVRYCGWGAWCGSSALVWYCGWGA